MPANRPPSPRPPADPTPRELAVRSADLLPADLAAALAAATPANALPVAAAPAAPVDEPTPAPLPRYVIAARIALAIGAVLLAAGVAALLVVDLPAPWLTVAQWAAGAGIVTVLLTAGASARPEQ